MDRYILASHSPRREELLKKIVKEFTVHPSTVDESKIDCTDPVEFAMEAAEAKARDVGPQFPSDIIIGSDTVVALDRRILGKPTGRDEAREMLRLLSGKKHKVISGIALYLHSQDKLLKDYDLTYVEFKDLTIKEIEDYLDTGDYEDKAGSYAIQKIGDTFVHRINGDYDNVVGLPTSKLKRLIKKFNIPELSVEIEDIALPNDYGVARSGGETYFVPRAVLGSKILIRPLKRHKGTRFAEISREEVPSPFLVEPQCPHFGPCGGCIFQNLSYDKQLDIKGNHLRQTLKKMGKIEAPKELNLIPSPNLYHYRNKMEFAFGEDQGQVILGLRRRANPMKKYQRVAIPLQQCKIFSSKVEKIFSSILDFVNSREIRAYNSRSHKGDLRHLVLREGKNTNSMMAVLVTSHGEFPWMESLSEILQTNIPAIKSFYWVKNDRLGDVVDFEESSLVYGETHISEILHRPPPASSGTFPGLDPASGQEQERSSGSSIQYSIGPQTFFQPNPRTTELLYKKIQAFANLRGTENVLGLYCGAGSIELYLAENASKVMGIDSVSENIQAAKLNAGLNNITNATFLEGDVEEVLKDKSFPADILILDPPRAGIRTRHSSLLVIFTVFIRPWRVNL